jgi:mono/diheme cytochrome c family protein
MNTPSPSVPRVGALTLFLVLVLAGCGAPSGSESSLSANTSSDDPLVRGQALFETYCQGCHGPHGEGNGPVAPLLTLSMTDLGELYARYGEFPEEYVASTIDGRAELEGHGSREMPVWGNIWTLPDDPVSQERINRQIDGLVEFVRSLQDQPLPAAQ